MEVSRRESMLLLKKEICICMEEEFKNNVGAFYTRDDVSQQTVTQAKIRMQKRFLVDTLKNLHKK